MTQVNDNDIAIVGMAIRVAGALTTEQYWQNLCDAVESLRTYSDEELLERGVSRADLADPAYVKAGMPLEGMEEFDPEFFGFSPKEAAILDPQHRQFYEVAWEALERAGHPPARFDGNVAVFAGSGMATYFARNLMSNPDLMESVGFFLLRHTGNDKDFLATRVSYAFDLKGPAINVQTACSTSLVAVHLAVQSLLAGECDMALAGGCTVELPHRVGYHYKEGEILSPDGHCRPFDHRSKGTVFGSGCGVVVLRRLADALEAGDHIHAVIKGTAVNNDGAGKVGYLAPSVDGQAAAIAEALAISAVEADSVGYIECHGTGTPVGDPIEVAALTNAFRESTDRTGYCRIGSVKSNIGHTDTAAGVVGLIKAALALEHGQIPPSLGFEAPNPAIPFDGSPFRVADRLERWKSNGRPRRAGVNSLGVGGTNAFAILEEPPRQPAPAKDDSPQLLVLSARSRRTLDEAGTRLAEWLSSAPRQPLADIAYTLFEGRHAFEHRRVFAAASHEEAIALLEEPDPRRVFTHADEVARPSVVFMYPGGGAQYFRMGRGLYESEPVFREHIDRGLALLKSRFNTELTDIFLAENGDEERVNKELARPSVQLPLIFMVEVALTRLWEHYGVKPAAVMGHSLGENTAAHIAGVLSFEDALGLVLLRGQLMDEVPEGGMLSVSMPAAELREELGDSMDLAAANSPQLSVASGTAAQITELAERLAARGIDSQRVRINIAAHSRLLEGILERFGNYLKGIRLHAPQLPIISNRSGKWMEPAQAQSPAYWVEHLRNTVFFADGVGTLLESPDRVFIEVGPGHTLGALVRQNPAAPAQRVFASLRHPEDPVDDLVFFRTVLGRLWAVGVRPDIAQLWPTPRRRVPLPTYPFQHARYWIEPGVGHVASTADDIRPLRQENFDDWFRVPRWVQQGILETSDDLHTWLVFLDEEPVAAALVERLRAGGHTVVTVQAGDTYARLDDHSFMIAPEAAGAGYLDLIETLAEDELLPDRILHTWLLTWERTFRPGSTFFHRNQEFGFYSLFHLAQALGKAGGEGRPIHWIVAANGTQRIGSEPLPCPDKATALGPVSVIPREFPGFTCRFVDVALPEIQRARGRNGDTRAARAEPVVEALASELEGAAQGGLVAWRDGVRWERHLQAWKPRDTTEAPRLRQQGVYLITGGLGGIAGIIAEWLITRYQARVALLARTPLPARADWDDWLARHPEDDSISRAIQRVRQLEALGGEVLPVAGDVTVSDRMQEVVTEIRERFGPINGVFHAAGVIRDNLIQLKSQRDIEDVFAAKVYGTVVLDEVLREEPLDFTVLFSSNSAFVAPQGQVDYVGANAFLNAWADSRQDPGTPVIAVNWGIWKHVGMVAGGAQAAPATEHETSYPLFTSRSSARDGTARLHTLRGSLSARAHWMVDEHRLAGGEALLPGTGYLELIRAALAESGIGDHWQARNLVFQNPLFVADDAPREFEVRLRGNDRAWQAEVLARQIGAEGWESCATANVRIVQPPAETVLPIAEIRGRCTDAHEAAGGSGALRTRQEDHLRFGPRWHTLKRLDFGPGEALAVLELPEKFAADLAIYALHPALLDIATGCAMDLIPGYAGQEVTQNLWAPLSYRAFSRHAPLPRRLQSWVQLNPNTRAVDGFAVFDVVLADEQGRVVAEVEQLTLRRLDKALEAPDTGSEVAVTAEGQPVEQPRRKTQSAGEVALNHNATQGIEPEEGTRALERVLSVSQAPSTIVVSSMAVPALLRQAAAVTEATTKSTETRFTRPQLDSDFEPPRNDVEKYLAELWGKLLGVEGVGIRDSFFDLGGHSLIAVRLFNDISERYGVDLPISALMQAPTVAALGELIVEEAGPLAEGADGGTGEPGQARKQKGPAFQFIVPMHIGPVADGTPLFMVSGMFGNVLNLSHMAHLLGEERPFYALQARGLYGDTPPHETFEEMATDYLAEIRQVQPEGPYLLGGFSGGGIVAYEMARQLLEAGETVTQVILLDTPVPKTSSFSLADKIEMLSQGLRHGGLKFVREKVRDRIAWEQHKLARREENRKAGANDALTFQSQRIGDAFVRAVDRYALPEVPVRVALFRPKLDVRFKFKDGRRINADRRYINEDNFWTPYVASLEVMEVPGNHDNMVLEPNVRVLVSGIGASMSRAENALHSRAEF